MPDRHFSKREPPQGNAPTGNIGALHYFRGSYTITTDEHGIHVHIHDSADPDRMEDLVCHLEQFLGFEEDEQPDPRAV